MTERFADVIQQEREHLNREREEVQERLAEIDRELAAIEAYETTKRGKPTSPGRRQVRARRPRARTRKSTKTRAAAPRGSRREALLRIIQENPTGLRRREIIARLGVKGDKTGEMSISNALTALTKAHHLERRDGKYVPALTGSE